ncbi:hypothetical protein [Flavobacterium sp.]|uniref:hypothetical protein n=1 Tax=Flavobacterium sp. TaxID=239 RepID=UPI0025F333CF|nr:hypothetical protein [Flavobacterium sp.]
MKSANKLGIWMDHANAYIIKFGSEDSSTKSISSDFSADDKKQTLQRSENEMHNKEQQKQGTFYKNLSLIIKDFDEVLLFGPTEAKSELHNLLKANHQFDKIIIEVKNTDKMTDKEQHNFVTDYFTRFDFKK